MTTSKDIEAVVAELSYVHDQENPDCTTRRDEGVCVDCLQYAAARLVLDARQEGRKWSEAHGRLCGQRDSAVAERDAALAEAQYHRDVQRQATEALRDHLEVARKERDAALAAGRDAAAQLIEARTELRDALAKVRAEGEEAKRHAAELLAYVSGQGAKNAQLRSDIQAILAPIETTTDMYTELEAELAKARTELEASRDLHFARVQELLAEGAENARLREAFDYAFASAEAAGEPYADTVSLSYLRNALAGKEVK